MPVVGLAACIAEIVIAIEAKQSIDLGVVVMDCFVALLLAMTESLAPQPRSAIEPGEIVVVILRGFRAHDGVADAGVFA